jgi:hypothetical protein
VPRTSPTSSYGGRLSDPAARTPSYPPPTGRLPAAANGTDLNACRKGRCEVQVSPHDKIPTPSPGKITVTAITADGITLTRTSPGTVLTVSWGGPGQTSYLNDLAITLVAVADGKAVLRITRTSQ